MLTEAYVLKRGYVYGTLQNVYSQIGTIFCGAIALILIFKHRGNIKRLLNGTEKKFGVKES
jgi:glycerol-3-phosphate acyltransferase PlsY